MYGEYLAGYFAAMILFTVVLLIVGIIAYILMAMGLYKLAQNHNIENPWLAWIPIGNFYIIGKLIKSLNLFGWEVPSVELALPIAGLAMVILSWIPVLGWLISIAFAVVMIMALYKLFMIFRPQQAVLYLIVSIITGGFMASVFLFIMRNDRATA
jgi:hypothetical protein